MEPLDRIYRNRRVLVFGHTGFKGSWLAFWLTRLGAQVTGMALAPAYPQSHFGGLGLERTVRHIEADIRDLGAVKRAFAEARPEIVFHLAAQAIVGQSYADPKATFDTNIGGSVNILEAVRANDDVRALVYVTSDKCYRNKEWIWGYRENDELGGSDPYSASKAAAELVFAAYHSSFFAARPDLATATARAGNVIGGGDWAPDRLIPDCIRALEAGRPITLRNPSSTRPWQHVLDPLHGYLHLGRVLLAGRESGGSWNFGPELGGGATVEEVARLVVECWGSGGITILDAPPAFHEHQLLQLNIDKSRLGLGWHPRWDSQTAIRQTVAWYKAVLGGASVEQVSTAQIEAFMGGGNAGGGER